MLHWDNLKSMYQDMDRIEYLSQIGNIVMHINLNKGQMFELQQARQQNVNENDVDDSVNDSNDDHEDSLVVGEQRSEVKFPSQLELIVPGHLMKLIMLLEIECLVKL